MKVVFQNASLLMESDPFKKIERAGRVCYKSEDKITGDSAKKFVSAMINSNHHAMLEHATFVFVITDEWKVSNSDRLYEGDLGKFINITGHSPISRTIVSGNVRAINELPSNFFANSLRETLGQLFPELLYAKRTTYCDTAGIEIYTGIEFVPNLTDEERVNHKYLTFDFITNRGITHELVRHRIASFAQESSRYCNYSNDKFGNEVTVVAPSYYAPHAIESQMWEDAMVSAEEAYFLLLKQGIKPEQARGVLPNDLKAEIVVTANLVEWKHIFDLRLRGATGKPHPQIVQLMELAMKELMLILNPASFNLI